jgi:hypothetical protein
VLGIRLPCPAMGWMRSHIAVREGGYVGTGVSFRIALIDVRADDTRAGPAAGVLIASGAGAGEAFARGGETGAVGVALHTSSTSGAAVGEFCCCHHMVQHVSKTWVRGPGIEDRW